MPGPWQVFAAIIAYFLLAASARADSREQLTTESRLLLKLAIVRPFGAAFVDPSADVAGLPRGSHLVSFQARSTPAAGWILTRAARLTREKDLDDAARKIARGIVAVQEPSGRIPAQAVYSDTLSQRRPPGTYFDRAPTTACLGFLLDYLPDHAGDELTRRCAIRAAQWLLHEQTATGAWVTQIDHPEKKGLRLIRLDTPEFRDITFALTLAADVLKEPGLRHGASKAAELLARLRIDPLRTAGGLWRAAYYLDGSPCDLFDDRAGVDVLASRYAMQALIGQAIACNDTPADEAFRRAAATLSGLKYDDDLWRRVYLLNNNEVIEMPRGVAPQRETVFNTQRPDPDSIDQQIGTFGLPQVLRLADPAQRPRATSIEDDLTLSLVGLIDRPFTFPRPASAAEAAAAFEKGRRLWPMLAEPMPEALPDRLSRLSVLIYKLQIEVLIGGAATRPVVD
ncbi:MAG: hypothetical protein ABSH20_02430 [Tepidisphaeraceae bacterium]|jgi:hypothetical protein